MLFVVSTDSKFVAFPKRVFYSEFSCIQYCKYCAISPTVEYKYLFNQLKRVLSIEDLYSLVFYFYFLQNEHSASSFYQYIQLFFSFTLQDTRTQHGRRRDIYFNKYNIRFFNNTKL